MQMIEIIVGITVSLFFGQSLALGIGAEYLTKVCPYQLDDLMPCLSACEAEQWCYEYTYDKSSRTCNMKIFSKGDAIDCATYQPPANGDSKAQEPSVQCGIQASKYQPTIQSRSRIIGGTNAGPHSWPWALHIIGHLNATLNYTCGGSLIRVSDTIDASDIVVTAAHCVAGNVNDTAKLRELEKMEVVAGAHDISQLDGLSRHRLVTDLKFNPQYDVSSMAYDVAILKLNKPVKFNDEIRPVCLPQQDEPIPSQKLCAVAGWGRNHSEFDTAPPILQQLRLPVHTATTCKSGWQDEYDEKSMICAGFLGAEATSSVCEGDSGGMLACKQTASDPWILHGVTSFGEDETCLNETRPAIFSRIGSNLRFILDTAQQLTNVK